MSRVCPEHSHSNTDPDCHNFQGGSRAHVGFRHPQGLIRHVFPSDVTRMTRAREAVAHSGKPRPMSMGYRWSANGRIYLLTTAAVTDRPNARPPKQEND